MSFMDVPAPLEVRNHGCNAIEKSLLRLSHLLNFKVIYVIIIEFLFLFVLLCSTVANREIRKVWRKTKEDVAVKKLFFLEIKSV